jgi:O-antigen ligase
MLLAGQGDTMHGWSLMPDRTLNSLMSLSVPAAMIVNLAALGQRDRRALLPWLLGAIGANMLLGFLQLIVGGGGRFRPFITSDMETAVGFFANRNHGAVLIAAAIPLAACLATWRLQQPARRAALQLIIVGSVIMALLAVLAIGSRSGLIMAVVGVLCAIAVAWQDLRRGFTRRSKSARLAIVLAPVAGIAGLVALAMTASRGEAIRRMFDSSVYADIRVQSLPTSFALMRNLFPFGSGLGTFEAMYRAAEPRALLHLQYLNHAHNDYAELVIDAGLAGAAVLVAALMWYLIQSVRAFRPKPGVDGLDCRLAQAACGVVLIAALASITDYPVRTPIWMLVLAICSVWLVAPRASGLETDGSS